MVEFVEDYDDYETIKKHNGQILLVPMSDENLERLILRASDIEYQRRRTRWNTFDSAHGTLKIPSLCDQYASLKFSTLITDDIHPNYVSGFEPQLPKIDDEYFELVREFLLKYDGEAVRVICELFETFDGVIEEISHKVEGGTTDAAYEVTIEGLR